MQLNETTAVSLAVYNTFDMIAANNANFKAAMGSLAPFMGGAPERFAGNVVVVGSVSTYAAASTKLTFKEGKMEEALQAAEKVAAQFPTWEGAVTMVVTKVDDTTMLNYALYRSTKAMEANTAKVKEALGGLAALMAGPPERNVGPVVFTSLDSMEYGLHTHTHTH